ncbi:protein kinase [Variovorax sp. J22G21]|uniref:serine/threonine protein kinase n=1 Tax=Variovorax fucosicus TaxID=3053517 RepID=UPI002574D5F2|nr:MULTISPECIES: protein kinase [unclassified Variovorax]MDM0039159.1 protein kinase [Variovorax sp. J22R193]MDM0063935.1 protein kinase [Variovorax sp. J22G21]
MHVDSQGLRDHLVACLPSLVIEEVAAQSGQRVVYIGRFEDARIPPDVPPPADGKPGFLHGWESWGRIVVKVVAGASADALTRLQAETAILEELRPVNFPSLRFYNLFIENPVTDEPLPQNLYVSIEGFVESTPLSRIMANFHGKPDAVGRLCLGIANALMPLWVHPKRFVHRDIKPDNILIKPDGEVVVIDLGIVRETGGAGITQDGWGKAPLTLDYAAPEQIQNDKDAISFKTDFFALGILMYVLISGRHPFHTNPEMNNFELAEAIEKCKSATLLDLGAADAEVSGFVQSLMSQAPYMRPRTPAVLLEGLQKISLG